MPFILRGGPPASRHAAGFKCALEKTGESPGSFGSAECPSPTLISQLLSNCRAHRVRWPATYLDLVPLALERGEGTGAESPRRHSAVVPGGQVLVAEPHPIPPHPALPLLLPLASLFTVYSQDNI